MFGGRGGCGGVGDRLRLGFWLACVRIGRYSANRCSNVCARRIANEEELRVDLDLTKRQKEIFDFIRRYAAKTGYPPTVREIGKAVGLHSSSTVHAHLANLEKIGLLRRDPSKPRAIELLFDKAKRTILPEGSGLPLVGRRRPPSAGGLPRSLPRWARRSPAAPAGFETGSKASDPPRSASCNDAGVVARRASPAAAGAGLGGGRGHRCEAQARASVG